MKTKLVKAAALLCALAMMLGVFAGCGNQNSGSKAPESSAAASTPESSKTPESSEVADNSNGLDTSEEVELTLYLIGDRPAKQDEIEENYNALFKEKLNCTIKTNYLSWAEYRNKYPLIFSSGEEFDMAYTANWLNYYSLAQKGAFKSLDELWPTYAPNNFSKQSESAKQQATVDGHYYAIPTLFRTYNIYGPIYRTDILEGTDWDGKMENLNDYETYLSYVKEAAPEMEPVAIVSEGSEIDELFMQERGLYPVKGANGDFLWLDPQEAEPKIFTYYDYEKTPEFLELVNRWNEAGYFTKSALSDTDSAKVESGKAASRIKNGGTYEGEHMKHPEWGFKFANFIGDVSYSSFMQDGLAISNTSKNPERALAWYDLITGDEEAFRAWDYGIEGTSYEVIDGQVKMLNTDDYAESSLWAARTPDFFLPVYGSPSDLREMEKASDAKIQDGVGCQKFRGMNIDTSKVETEYAASINAHQQYWWPLELGYTDPVTGLEEYKQKMQAAGIDKVIEEFQRQLDEYLKQ